MNYNNSKLTELEKFGEEFQHPVAELCWQIFIGCCHHNLDQLATENKSSTNK